VCGRAQRRPAYAGYKVIIPVDCSAGDRVYREQYAAFSARQGRTLEITSNVTLTRTGMVKF
jgi:hypothetical protein